MSRYFVGQFDIECPICKKSFNNDYQGIENAFGVV